MRTKKEITVGVKTTNLPYLDNQGWNTDNKIHPLHCLNMEGFQSSESLNMCVYVPFPIQTNILENQWHIFLILGYLTIWIVTMVSINE